MNCFDFKFEPSYIGEWAKVINGRGCEGLLTIEEHDISIELFGDENLTLSTYEQVLYGKAFPRKDVKGKFSYNFQLRNLVFKSSTRFGNGLIYKVYDVGQILIYQEDFSDSIKRICLRTPIFDTWARKYKDNAYDYNFLDEKGKHFIIEYKQPKEYELFKDENFYIYLYFGAQRKFSKKGYEINSRVFFNIELKNIINKEHAIELMEEYKYLLFFVFNHAFIPDFIEYGTTKSNFILKDSDKSVFNHLNLNSEPDVFLTIDKDDIIWKEVFLKWGELYNLFREPIATYCNTISNSYLSPELRIKNYMSVLDALSKDIKGELTEQEKNKIDQNNKFFASIEERCKEVLDNEELQKLKKYILNIKGGKSMESRLSALVEELSDILDNSVDKDFITRIKNTRNNFTHPKKYNDYCFKRQELPYASYVLTRIIRAYILKELGIPKQYIKVMVQY